jgi:hypothetical protein
LKDSSVCGQLRTKGNSRWTSIDLSHCRRTAFRGRTISTEARFLTKSRLHS